MKAKRYNKGKNRHELISPIALEELAKVYTKGAHKYSVYKGIDGRVIKGSEIPFNEVSKYEMIEDASNNWKLGLSWKAAMGSVKRHISAWELGEDFDSDLGTYNLANAMWGLATLLDHYKGFPQGDDRDHTYLSEAKIGLDIDEVLADWLGAWRKLYGITEEPTSWWFDRNLVDKFDDMKKEGTLDEFYLGLKPLIKPEDIPFEPHCYITSRPVSTEITEKWLDMHGFPAKPVFTTTKERTKIVIAKEQGLDIFVDDSFSNFRSLNEAGICTFLMSRPHNEKHRVGFKRIKELKDFV